MPTKVVPEHEDGRDDGPMTGTPLAVMHHWLELYRETALLKVSGLGGEELAQRTVPPSSMSLVGVVRHLTEVEAYWVRVVLAGNEDVPNYYCTPESPSGDFDEVDPDTAVAEVYAYQREIAETRAILAEWNDPEALAHGERRGRAVNLGWILVHLIEEYARHLGHMDLLREKVDGRTGY